MPKKARPFFETSANVHYGNGEWLTLCGTGWVYVTNDPAQVTCENCKRILKEKSMEEKREVPVTGTIVLNGVKALTIERLRLRRLRKKLFLAWLTGWLLLLMAWAVSIGVWWSMFRSVQAQVPVAPVSVAPNCMDFSTDVRASFNGYIIDHVERAQMVWVTKLSVPYADITWYDAKRRAWREGNVPARALTTCELGIAN